MQRDKCLWQSKNKAYIRMPFETLIEIMEFALDNTLVISLDGKLKRQLKGIPMGDPHSPGMCIGACAWMEKEWIESIQDRDKEFFNFRRYMDDVITVYVDNPTFDHKNLLTSQATECYKAPLKLEDGGADTFLETTFEIKNNKFRYWLKNQNEIGKPAKVWRYSHFHSDGSYQIKHGVLMAVLKKIQKMSSDDEAIYQSALQKLYEFYTLKYPYKMLWGACTTMGVNTRQGIWFEVRNALKEATGN